MLLLLAARAPLSTSTLGAVVSTVFALHFAMSFGGSHGRHYSWVVFLVLAVLSFAATR